MKTKDSMVENKNITFNINNNLISSCTTPIYIESSSQVLLLM